ncbi:GFA family protein [Emcibacter nanhaiensis]|nr:GFA family protein [Emcibacter nanhaiensis]
MTRKAQCCCGACVVEVSSEPALHGVCNCNNCKKRTGSAFGISAYFWAEDVRVVSDNTAIYALSNDHGKQERHFCRNCGTTLYWQVEIFAGMTGVAGGCFAEDPLPDPTFYAMLDNKCAWVSFSEQMKAGLKPEDIPTKN